MQYFKPENPFFAGDCMPFYHDGTVHLYYLLDQGHHQGNGGLGGHQWAHASTTDLIHWRHHPLAVAITEPWEASICTGSVFWHEGVYYAFYATRRPDWSQHLSLASSPDGILFQKRTPNPLLSPPPGYHRLDFRDPFVFRDEEGMFHLLVTAKFENFPLHDRGGCLLRFSSRDLWRWQAEGPFFFPGGGPGYLSIPECPDYFEWNGWYYLIFGQGLRTRYRVSRQPFGPWEKPAVDLLDSPLLSVMKSCPFRGNRRIGAGFIGSRQDDQDSGLILWAGNIVLRELVQHGDGTLTTRFLPEPIPAACPPLDFTVEPLTPGVSVRKGSLCLAARYTQEVAVLPHTPLDFRLRCRVLPKRNAGMRFGLGMRGSGRFERLIALTFEPGLSRVTLADQSLDNVENIDRAFEIEVICRGELIDACIDQQRCLINRLPELRGDRLFFFCEYGEVSFEEVRVYQETALQTFDLV
jgi:hypothetical protein